MKTWIRERIRQRRMLTYERLTRRIERCNAGLDRLPPASEQYDDLKRVRDRLFWRRNDIALKLYDKE